MLDIGHLFRQGGKLFWGQNKEWRKAAKTAVDLYFREKNLGVIIQRRQAHPDYAYFKSTGLVERTTDVVADIMNRDEHYRGIGKLRKVPIIRNFARASERSFTEFANDLRFNVAYKYREVFGNKYSREDYTALSNFLNRATGQGNILGLEKSASAVAEIFFSPRWFMSNIQAPLYVASKSPLARKVAAKNIGLYYGAGITFLTLCKASGLEVETDRRSTDFAKLKIDNKRIDIFGGNARLIVFLERLRTKESAKNGKVRKIRAWDEITGYGRGKLAPSVGFAINAITGSNVVGDEYSFANWKQVAANELSPMILQDAYEAYDDSGLPGLTLMAPLAFTGFGASTYDNTEKRKSSKSNPIKFKPPKPPTYKLPKY
jgi:hypothetical protein